MDYAIVGNGVAGITAALTLRARDKEAAITVISAESDYFFSRTALMYAYMDCMSLRDLEPYERKVYTSQRIQLVRAGVVDINAAERNLCLDNGRVLGYDRLLLATGSLANRPAWPGIEAAKSGIATFVTLGDLQACEKLTRQGGNAVVVGGGLIGVELVECLSHHGMKVTFLVREPWYWPAALGGEEGQIISAHIARHGVNLIHQETVEEVLLDANDKVIGLRAASGENYPCEILGIAIGVHPAIEWLQDVTTRPLARRGIVVGPDFRTSLEGVWAAGDCAEIELPDRAPFVEQIWYSAKRQGELAAQSMLGDSIVYRPPIFYNSAKFFELEYTTVGEVNAAPAGSRSFFARHPTQEMSVRVVEYEDSVLGFNMIGSRWNHTFFERWIAQRRSMEYCLAHLGEAQFDVEFGRQELGFIGKEAAWSKQAVSNT